MSADQLDRLLAAVGVAPALPGARCRGKQHLFDERQPDESTETAEQRHQQALGLCRLCPALASCNRWFDTLTPSRRPQGVIAGRVIQPKGVGHTRRQQPPGGWSRREK